MIDIEKGSLVVLCCLKPKEQTWGLVIRLDACGVVIRGLDLDSVEDWLCQEKAGEASQINPSTVFVPMHRVQRIYRDESTDVFASFGDRFATMCGSDVRDALLRGSVGQSDEDLQ